MGISTTIKIEEIHKNLKERDIRDFLAKTYSECCVKGAFGEQEYIERQITELQDLLEHIKVKEVIEKLIEKNGWEILELDDEKVKYNINENFIFVGTQKEYENIFGK